MGKITLRNRTAIVKVTVEFLNVAFEDTRNPEIINFTFRTERTIPFNEIPSNTRFIRVIAVFPERKYLEEITNIKTVAYKREKDALQEFILRRIGILVN
jgi:hypothetical protein